MRNLSQFALVLLLLAQAGGEWTRRLVPDDPRPPRSKEELRRWLHWAVHYYHFTPVEIGAALGMSEGEVRAAIAELGVDELSGGPTDRRLVVLPYPGGRHPRAGFFEGAIRPRRDTKLGVFPPWEQGGYVVVDLPEAVWAGGELIYLAHTHIPTRWDRLGLTVPRTDWQLQPDGRLLLDQQLPEELAIRVQVRPLRDAVQMQISIRNGSHRPLRQLRAQVCVMLAEAAGFGRQGGENKSRMDGFAVCSDTRSMPPRHIVTAWRPLHRVWYQPLVPCIHADPRFPDCPPGQTVTARGILRFVEGKVTENTLLRLRKRLGTRLEWEGDQKE